MQVVSLQLQRAMRGAAQVARDVADIAAAVSQRASARGAKHLVFILDREDPTALELLTAYAPPRLQLARGSSDDIEVVALSYDDGLTLLRAPRHQATIFRVVADQIADDEDDDVIGVCVARGGFVRFALRSQTELN